MTLSGLSSALSHPARQAANETTVRSPVKAPSARNSTSTTYNMARPSKPRSRGPTIAAVGFSEAAEWACKPNPVPRGVAAIHLGPPLPTGLVHPTRDSSEPGRLIAPYLGLLAVGFAVPRTSPPARCALTAPFHPCLCCRRARRQPSAVCFLWHFPWDHSRWPLATTVPCPVRTFLRRIVTKTPADGRLAHSAVSIVSGAPRERQRQSPTADAAER